MQRNSVRIASPGRINLIGEHIDYNGGKVLPAAIDLNISLFFQVLPGTKCEICADDLDESFEFDINDVQVSPVEWHNYVLGVVHFIRKMRPQALSGFSCTVKSNLPIGSGLSSSAALECGVAKGLNALFDLQLSDEAIIKLSRNAEHHYVGTKCGIMDQFAVVKGKPHQFMLLDCETLSFEYIPADFGNYEVLLLNSNVSHSLATSEYNVRRAEVEAGFKEVARQYPEYKQVVEIPMKVLIELKEVLSPVSFQRLQYAIEEHQRTLMAAKCMKKSEWDVLGELIYQSHYGLRDLYQVSCPELDFLVAFSESYGQVLGARMMGGGFGGCVIHLIEKDFSSLYTELVKPAYKEEFGIELTPIKVSIGKGTHIVLDGHG